MRASRSTRYQKHDTTLGNRKQRIFLHYFCHSSSCGLDPLLYMLTFLPQPILIFVHNWRGSCPRNKPPAKRSSNTSPVFPKEQAAQKRESPQRRATSK